MDTQKMIPLFPLLLLFSSFFATDLSFFFCIMNLFYMNKLTDITGTISPLIALPQEVFMVKTFFAFQF